MTTLEVMLLVFLGVATVALGLVAVLALVIISRLLGAAVMPTLSRAAIASRQARQSERAQVGAIEP